MHMLDHLKIQIHIINGQPLIRNIFTIFMMTFIDEGFHLYSLLSEEFTC